MKLVFRQYLASLRERDELDAVLPDLLSELGYTVISRPTIGTRQYGVDVAAVGNDTDGKRKLFLFSLKRGDLTRADWDGNPQALRSSINDILDVYIPTRIAKAHEKLDVVICLCFGGDIEEAVRDNVTQFTKQHSVGRISFQEWNGDHMAGLLVDGVLREQLIDKALRGSFQKAVAMVDEPDVAFTHFSTLIRRLCAVMGTTPKQRATIVRQLYICLWVQFVWARDAGNVESPYRASELAMLHAWHLVRGDVAKSTKGAEEVSHAFNELVNLHFLIWEELLAKKVLPYVGAQHAISVAVDSAAAVDVNIKLFEILGRLALRGLWILWLNAGDANLPDVRADWQSEPANELAQQIMLLIRNNPILLTPIADSQSIDISLALVFLTMMEPWHPAAGDFAKNLTQRTTFAFKTHNKYPAVHDDYRSLLVHPRERTDEYRERETKGSTLFPLLSLWASSLGEAESAEYLAQFGEKYLGHCNTQMWFPDDDSEEKLYRNDGTHGACLNNVPITSDGGKAMRMLEAECAGKTAFDGLSAIRLGHWPIVATASRHYRLPLPPKLWLDLLRTPRDVPAVVISGPADVE